MMLDKVSYEELETYALFMEHRNSELSGVNKALLLILGLITLTGVFYLSCTLY